MMPTKKNSMSIVDGILCWKNVDLPCVPKEMVDAQIQSMTKENQIFYIDPKHRDITYSKDRRCFSTEYYAYGLAPTLKDWLLKHIHGAFCQDWPTGAVRTKPGPGNSTTMTAHTDHRDWKLMYVMEPGGKDAKTVFWREPGIPLLRPKDVGLPRIPAGQDSLVEISAVECDAGQWYLINGGVLHGATGVTGERSVIHVAFDNFPEVAK
jgi:hypothetical protein